jgi:hypothetical protein
MSSLVEDTKTTRRNKMGEDFEKTIHILTKKALRGDIDSAKIVIEFLSQTGLKQAKAVAYLIVYQIIMNNLIDLGEECRQCGGICCRFGEPIQLYDFDLDDLRNAGIDIDRYITRRDGSVYLSRPCPFQDGWRCTIHSVKPYACLSYPFAVEDIQKDVIERYISGIPEPFIPSFCRAGWKTWNTIKMLIDNFRHTYNKDPSALELLDYAIQKLKKVQNNK